MAKEININKASSEELREYVFNNARFVNLALSDFEQAGEEGSPAYRYIQDKAVKKYGQFLSLDKNGNYRLNKTKKSEIANMSQWDLRRYAKLINDYKSTKTGTLRGYTNVIQKGFDTFKRTTSLKDISFEDFKKLVKNGGFQDFKERFSSNEILKFVEDVGVDKALTTFTDKDVTTIIGLYRKADEVRGTKLD